MFFFSKNAIVHVRIRGSPLGVTSYPDFEFFRNILEFFFVKIDLMKSLSLYNNEVIREIFKKFLEFFPKLL